MLQSAPKRIPRLSGVAHRRRSFSRRGPFRSLEAPRHLRFDGLLLKDCGVRALWSGLSIQRKNSLLIGGLVLVVAATYSWAAYGGMRRAPGAPPRERGRRVTAPLARPPPNNPQHPVTKTRALAARPAPPPPVKPPP